MGKTSIEWTQQVWNPTRGCSRVSKGCEHCYAESIAARFSTHSHQDGETPGGTFAGFAVMQNGKPHWTGKVELIPDMLDIPLRRRKPTTWFVNSMSDLFHEALSFDDVAQVFAVMALCPQHVFQVLTKRPERMLEYCRLAAGDPDAYMWVWADNLDIEPRLRPDVVQQEPWPLKNVWLGVSVEDQPTADKRIVHLMQTPAALRFVSYEPALGPVYFGAWLDPLRRLDDFYRSQIAKGMFNNNQVDSLREPILDWIIVGGESGPGARPFDLAWARETVAQCRVAGVPCFVKQLGARPQDRLIRYNLTGKGGDPEEWPADLRVREMPHRA